MSSRQTSVTRVIALGDSITRAQVSADYVQMLRERTAGRPFEFTNAGVNGDLAYNVLGRLDAVVAQRPDVVTVLVGTNDANASLSERNVRMFMRMKRLPVAPTIGWYRENLAAIVERLTREPGARVALLSLPVLGQELGSEPVRRSTAYSDVVREVAAAWSLDYLPLHERQLDHLRRAGRAPGIRFRDGRTLQSRAAIQHFLLRRSLDGISRRRGLELTTDLIHQNSRGAAMIADLIEELLAPPA